MSATGLEVFDTTLQKTNSWLKELMEEMSWDRHKAYQALRAVLHALRDRLTVEEVAELGAQLPMLIRGIYYEGWDPTGKPVKQRHREQFLARIREYFKTDDDVDPETIARAVFCLLSKRVTSGEIEDVKHILPREIRDLWPGGVLHEQAVP
jgi:uncharacterized protein (DUF2267 family)